PLVTNTNETNVYSFQATLNADVAPNGGTSPTVVFRFSTTDMTAATGTTVGATLVPSTTTYAATVTGLTPGATYYYRAEATNDGGTTPGTPETFTTKPSQLVTTGAFSNLTSSSAHLAGSVNPNGLATQARFRYGTSPNSQQFTPVVNVGAGTAAVPFEADIAGLPANRRIYYTLRTDRVDPVNENAIEGPQLSFVTDRRLTAITAAASRVTYDGTSTIKGQLAGDGVGDAGLIVEAQRYPYDQPFVKVLEGKTAANGSYSLRLGKNTRNTKIRVSTTGNSVVISAVKTLYVMPRVGLTIKKSGTKRILTGTVRPKLGSSARAKIQRRSGSRWVTVRTVRLTDQSSASSRYTTSLRRRKNTKYRVQVSSGSQSYATGISTTRKVR
ncbi:MAG TPA: hypothetical protein VNT22_09575, partial [Baekduia sp.]|nr:hypothetical protein [Baekduia sp.]